MKKSSKLVSPVFQLPKEKPNVNSYNDIDTVVNDYMTNAPMAKTKKHNERITYYNIPCAFDIETTSTKVDGEKIAFMYCWQFCFNGAIVFGRTWEEFDHVINRLTELLNLSNDNRLIIYVHNLSFEFQFIRKRLEWSRVFALDEREPVQAVTTGGIEFRCSYKLSGYGLEKLGDQLLKYKVHKLVGNLDYSVIRTAKTPLTEKEIWYCVNDVLVVAAYIQERIEDDGNIAKIPLTKTGYVRIACRKNCLPTDKDKKNIYYKYKDLMKFLTLTTDEYKQLKRAYAGGFTHANAFYSGQVLENVGSFDFTSSYPAVMCSEKFPMSKAEIVNPKDKKEFIYYLHNYCCLFDISFTNMVSTSINENPLSFSKCWGMKKYVVNNGRIVSADEVCTTITEQDFMIINKFYTWDSMKLGTFRIYRKGYLPREIVLSILEFYETKTTLKNVEGKEIEYLKSKENVNSCYGMMVTDICRDEIIYGDEWGTMPSDIDSAIQNYNESQSRFLFYPWGVWVTAYARKNLFTGIYEFGNDYVYSDTDSIKGLNVEKHMTYINEYNDVITEKIQKCLKWNKIPFEMSHPRTIEGKEKPLGVWDYEGMCNFKTLGSKRYMTFKHDTYNITVSGLNKKVCVPYILDSAKKLNIDPFDFFDNEMYIPPEFTGKLTHTYIDEEQLATIVDVNGVPCDVFEYSSVHISPCEYSMSLATNYIDYLKGIREMKTD